MGKLKIVVLYDRVLVDEDDSSPGEDFAVIRAKHRMLRQSYVGMLYTGRHARETDLKMLNTVGADFRPVVGRPQSLQTKSP